MWSGAARLDSALCRGALHISVVGSAEDEPDAGDADLGQAALPRTVINVGGENAPHSAALPRPWTQDSDPEIEDLLRCTPEPRYPPVCFPDRTLTPGAARITVEAANEPAVNVEAVFERLQAVDNEHPPTLNSNLKKDDRGQLRIANQNYLNTRRGISAIEGQFRAYNNLKLLLPRDVFWPHPDLAGAQAELELYIKKL